MKQVIMPISRHITPSVPHSESTTPTQAKNNENVTAKAKPSGNHEAMLKSLQHVLAKHAAVFKALKNR